MKECQYELKHHFDYAKGGDTQKACFISLTAPTFRQMSKVAEIKQAFTSAISEMTTYAEGVVAEEAQGEAEEGGDGKNTVTGPQVMQIMYRWSGDISKVLSSAEQLFKSGVAMVDGEVRLTPALMDKMQMDDFEGILGEYIANFIAPSLMDGV